MPKSPPVIFFNNSTRLDTYPSYQIVNDLEIRSYADERTIQAMFPIVSCHLVKIDHS